MYHFVEIISAYYHSINLFLSLSLMCFFPHTPYVCGAVQFLLVSSCLSLSTLSQQSEMFITYTYHTLYEFDYNLFYLLLSSLPSCFLWVVAST